MYTETTPDNYGRISSGAAVWKSLSKAERGAVNSALLNAGGRTYEELLADVPDSGTSGDDGNNPGGSGTSSDDGKTDGSEKPNGADDTGSEEKSDGKDSPDSDSKPAGTGSPDNLAADTETDDTPSTGDENNTKWFVLLLVVSCVCMAALTTTKEGKHVRKR